MSEPRPFGGSNEARALLEALNVFMADMQAGVGPFLGAFLSQHAIRPHS